MNKIRNIWILIFLCFIFIGNVRAEDDYKYEMKIYDSVSDPKYSPNGSISYTAVKDGVDIIIEDGVESIRYDNRTLKIYSSNIESFSYIIQKDGKYVLFKDGKEIAKYDYVGSIMYSPDNKGFSYMAKKDNKWMVVKDGVEGILYDAVYNLTYSPDGSGFVYVAKNGSKEFLIKDGKKGDEYDAIYTLLYSLDSKEFIIKVAKNGKQVIVINGVESIEYDDIGLPNYFIDSEKLAYVVKINGRRVLINDGKEITKYDYVGNPTYGLEGKSFSYTAEINSMYFVVKDGIESNRYSLIYPPIYSPDGSSYAFGAFKSGKRIVVKDGVEGIGYDDISLMNYSSNSKSFSYVAKKDGKYFIVKDGKESGETDNITSLFMSPDGKNFAFIALKDGKRVLVQKISEGESVDENLYEEISETQDSVQINNKNIYVKQLILSKTKLSKTLSGKSQIKSIDSLINKQTTEKLKIIFKNITTIKSRMNEKTKNKYSDILDYLEASIGLKLEKENIQQKDLKQTKIDIESLKKACNGFEKEDKFYKFFSCFDEKKDIYVVDTFEYTKDEYQKKYEEYMKNGEICDKDEIPLEIGELKAECKKGEYAIYYKKGEKITYGQFKKLLMEQSFQSIQNEQKDEQDEYMKKITDGLKDLKTFKENLVKGTFEGIFQYEKIGNKCIYSGEVLYNGSGLNIECENNKITLIKYIINNEKVSEDAYIEYFYKELRKNYNLD